jgi:lipopolysaccharide export system permease protein
MKPLSLLDRYIGKGLLSGIGVALFALLAIFFFINFSSEIDDVGEGNYDLYTALKYVLLGVPGLMYELLPLASLIGALYSLGNLASNSELIVIRASGFSGLRLTGSVVMFGFLLALFVFLLGEWVVPYSQRSADILRDEALLKVSYKAHDKGIWFKEKDDFLLVHELHEQGKRLEKIEIFKFSENLEPVIYQKVESGDYTEIGPAQIWMFNGIQELGFSNESISLAKRDSAVQDLSLRSEGLSALSLKPNDLPLLSLIKSIRDLSRTGHAYNSYTHELYQRLAQPFTVLVLISISLPFVMRSVRMVPVGQRIFLGIGLGVVFYLLDKTLDHMGVVFNLNPIISAFSVPIAFFFVGAVIALRRDF